MVDSFIPTIVDLINGKWNYSNDKIVIFSMWKKQQTNYYLIELYNILLPLTI